MMRIQVKVQVQVQVQIQVQVQVGQIATDLTLLTLRPT